jgi:hypothetical protein
MSFVVSYKTRVLKFAQSVKQLNLFKMYDDGTDNPIKRQKIITRIYLILLVGMFFSLHMPLLLLKPKISILILRKKKYHFRSAHITHMSMFFVCTSDCPWIQWHLRTLNLQISIDFQWVIEAFERFIRIVKSLEKFVIVLYSVGFHRVLLSKVCLY